jgi:diacylglycerol kinase
MKNKNWGDSFKNALNGIFYVIKAERNMKLHILAALVVVLLSVAYRLDRIEAVFVCIAIGAVIVCELFNTAIEVLVDLIVDCYNPKAKIIKDAAAGAVLISAIVSGVVGYMVFIDRVSVDAQKVVKFLKGLDVKIATGALCIGLILFFGYIITQKKGMTVKIALDSGIAFLLFSMATAVLLLNDNIKTSILFIGIAAVTVLSRVERNLKNFFELLSGAVIGFVLVLLVYLIYVSQ